MKLTKEILKKLIKEELEEGRVGDMASKAWKSFKTNQLGMSEFDNVEDNLNRYNKVVQLAARKLKSQNKLGIFKNKLDYRWGLEKAPALAGETPFENEFKRRFQMTVRGGILTRNENPDNIPFYDLAQIERGE